VAMAMMMQYHHNHGATGAVSGADFRRALGWLSKRRAGEEWKVKRRVEVWAARKNQAGSRYQQTKRWKVDESVKKIGHAGIERFRSSFEDKESASAEGLVLRGDQAVGQVVAAQANFMRVFIERTGHEEQGEGGFYGDEDGRQNGASTSGANAWEVNCGAKSGTELLCVVRAVLKKIKRRVLVGDRVLVSGIDWTDRRGMVEDVLDRRSEIAEPPVANVEHLLVLFAFDRPKLEPAALSRFLVEAESTGIPFTLILNKTDLVSQQVRCFSYTGRRD
jgi:translation initiation factor IF-1